jgi:predicted SprT family Zn-dependent metalloprotease
MAMAPALADDEHYYDCPSCEERGHRYEVREIARDRFGRMLYQCGNCGAQITESLLRTAHRWRLMHNSGTPLRLS